MTPRPTGERGLTLTELVLVIALAGVVTLGLMSFYFNSQATWIDGSTQAMTQREATQVVQVMTDSVHGAQSAVVFSSPDALHEGLSLTFPDGHQCGFWWDQTDSLVHHGENQANDRGPIVTSKVERFELDRSTSMVFLNRLEMRSANGQRVHVASSMALLNHP